MTRVPPTTARRLGRGFAALSVVTYVLIVLGALVRAHGAGLACPDWPLCFGRVLPQFDMEVAFEWSHRALAGSVSAGLAALSWAAWRQPDLRAWLRPRLILAWSLLGLQVVFGGLTVLLHLAPWTVSVHLVLGNSFCLALLWIALDLYQIDRAPPPRESVPAALSTWTGIAAACLILQIVLGGLVASHGAGLSCGSFPTCNGVSLVPSLSGLIGIHVLHRLNGFVLLGSLVGLAWVSRHDERVGRLARTGLRLVAAQILIGVADVLLRLPVEITALHTAMATAIVIVTALLARELLLARAGVGRGARQSARMAATG